MKTLPQVYYGLHMVEGTAEYREPGKEPYRIYIGEDCLKQMDSTFTGRPVFVDHRDKVNLDTLEVESDGYVVESFFLPCDGKHWSKFIVTSDKGHESIRMGWVLSNSYVIKERGVGGQNHGVDYVAEVMRGEYDHLAIVKKPRYEESKILTPDQFKDYVAKKELELSRVANSSDTEEPEKGDSEMIFFKKSKVDNSADLENTVVQLPKSKVELTITQLVNEMDKYRLEMPLPKMANDDDYVEMNGKKVNVKDMKDCYNTMQSMKEEEEKKNAEEEEMKKKENETSEAKEREAAKTEKKDALGKDGGESGKDKAKNAEEEEMKKKENEAKEMEEKKKNQLFNDLANAHLTPIKEERTPDLSGDRVSRGKSRYGSK